MRCKNARIKKKKKKVIKAEMKRMLMALGDVFKSKDDNDKVDIDN